MSGLHNKLYNYEQTPPAKVWEKIEAALDESYIADEFPSRIYNAEVMPPAATWDKIASSLEIEHATAIPMPHKSFSFFRYAAAAAIIGLVAFGVIKWANGNTSGEEMAIINTDSIQHKNNIDLPKENTTGTNTEKDINPEENIADIPTNTDQAKVTSIKKTTKYSIPADISNTEPIYAYNEHTPNLSDRYIMLMTPDGGIIRMSKKWGDLVCCVSGQEQDENCKDQIKKWQEKIACSPVTTSPGNFMDILSLVNSLNENEL